MPTARDPNDRIGATAGYTGSRGTGEVRPRGKPCCHRLQNALEPRPGIVQGGGGALQLGGCQLQTTIS